MSVEKELNKALRKIGRKIYKKLELPKDIKRYIGLSSNVRTLSLDFSYAGKHVYTLNLQKEYGECFYTIYWLATEVHDEFVQYASDKALKDLAVKEDNKHVCK